MTSCLPLATPPAFLNIYETILNVIQKSAWGRLDVDLHVLYRLEG